MVSKYIVKLSLSNPEQTGILNLFKAGEGEDENISFYEYDCWNQLKKTVQGKKTITYAYNGEGYRVKKEMNGEKSNYLYEGDKVILETDGQGQELTRNTKE